MKWLINIYLIGYVAHLAMAGWFAWGQMSFGDWQLYVLSQTLYQIVWPVWYFA